MKGVNDMSNSIKITKSNQEKIKMRKIVVDAPELKGGQIYSSGGIRENGKISVQYKNPVPYDVETKTSKRDYTQKDMLKDQAKDLVMDVGVNIAFILWYDYGKPLLQAKVRQLCQNAIAHIEKSNPSSLSLTEKNTETHKVIDVEYDEIQEVSDLERI
jgi:hypothetical protein